ncbi:MAG TPA: DUF2007 domain-containing protein [Candidatus Omnitrophota bacterium]|nr:DUF2007 domain-containing protein [Candidatus Omnitrophota bacterium]HPB68032.1 DUF2007 domain-containing protein [Candidatus Omnitrophota bacterium]HQO57741.1 DUF2007 domain-containing protein [Candidatus Omnitrophota bacterium]HQP12424.1 DUF2007 domain-containing protein [Candidatus Omnitrophota bacterium]
MAYVELVRTFNQGDIALIKSLLLAEGIEYYLQGEDFNLVRPLAVPPVFMVREEQYQDAREIIQGLNISLGSKTTKECSPDETDKIR